MTAVFKKYSFWAKVMDTCALFGSVSTVGMGAAQTFWDAHIQGGEFIGSGTLAVVSVVLRIWITDQNKDGIIDILEDDNVTAVKVVETKTTTVVQDPKT